MVKQLWLLFSFGLPGVKRARLTCINLTQNTITPLNRINTRKNAHLVTNLQQACSNAVATTCYPDMFVLLVRSLLTTYQRLVAAVRLLKSNQVVTSRGFRRESHKLAGRNLKFKYPNNNHLTKQSVIRIILLSDNLVGR